VVIAPGAHATYAVADDGTAWVRNREPGARDWVALPALPDREPEPISTDTHQNKDEGR
jgi:hypothetical protein